MIGVSTAKHYSWQAPGPDFGVLPIAENAFILGYLAAAALCSTLVNRHSARMVCASRCLSLPIEFPVVLTLVLMLFKSASRAAVGGFLHYTMLVRPTGQGGRALTLLLGTDRLLYSKGIINLTRAVEGYSDSPGLISTFQLIIQEMGESFGGMNSAIEFHQLRQ